MKLSEAMLKGCKGTKKCIGVLGMGETKCCALDAAMRGIGLKAAESDYNKLAAQYPELRQYIKDPLYTFDKGERYLSRAIMVRNDDLGWSRLKIAKWLKSIGF